MLVLTRRVGQQILVDDHIVVTICRITRNRVRVGIEAPPSVPVLRAEIADHPSLPGAAQHDEEPLQHQLPRYCTPGLERTAATGTTGGPTEE
jgi:carbon storage regulator